jgi:CHASE2 domain-containing sensor protein
MSAANETRTGGVRRSFLLLVLAGALVGAIAVACRFAEPFMVLEENIGLRVPFLLRGHRVPPSDAVIVSMTRVASEFIALPSDYRKYHGCIDLHVGAVPAGYLALPASPLQWPRCVHARLLNALKSAGADTVVFDIVFRPRPPSIGPADGKDEDELLAASIAAADKVILAQKLERLHVSPSTQSPELDTEQPVLLSPKVERAAFGMAPMLISESVNHRFDRFFAFKKEG